MSFKDRKENLFFEKIILLIISCFIFFTMYYYDNQLTFVYIIENMDRIVSGKWYYLFNGWSSIPYGLVLQGICAVWALPVFILSKVGLISTISIGARLWYKLFVLLFLILDTRQIGIVAEQLDIKDERRIIWLRLYFLSSLSVILPAVHIAQMDAVYLFPVLLGISYYLRNEYHKFLICFAIAIPIKFLPIFIFVPLVVLHEKRYLYIMRDLSIGAIGILIDKALKSIGYRIEMHLGIDPSLEIWDVNSIVMQSSLGNLFENGIWAFNTKFSITVCLFLCLCIWCYMKKSQQHNLVIFVSLLGILCLFVFGTVTPYWILLIVPFLLLLIFENDKYYRILLPLELIISLSFLYIAVFQTKWIYGSEDTFDFLLFRLIPGYMEQVHGYVADFMTQRGLNGFEGIFSACCVACTGGMIALTNPVKEVDSEYDSEPERYIKGWYWARIAVLVVWLFLNLWVVAGNHVAA